MHTHLLVLQRKEAQVLSKHLLSTPLGIAGGHSKGVPPSATASTMEVSGNNLQVGLYAARLGKLYKLSSLAWPLVRDPKAVLRKKVLFRP